MTRRVWLVVGCLALAVGRVGGQQPEPPDDADAYLAWTTREAQRIGQAMRVDGRVGGVFDLRGLHTDRAYNYKLRATWLTSDVIRAAARLAQESSGLTNDQTRALVAEADGAGDTVVLVEIDPREGSGVIPLEWFAFLGPRGGNPGEPGVVRGTSVPALRNARALSGTFRRDYAYEVFWIVFPLRTESGAPIFPIDVSEAELIVRIHDKEGRVRWRVPDAVRVRSSP